MNKFRIALKNIIHLCVGCCILAFSLFLFLAIISYDDRDPSLNTITNSTVIYNYMGTAGSYTADFFIQFFGVMSLVFIPLLLKISYNLIRGKLIRYNSYAKIIMFMIFTLSGCGLLSSLFFQNNLWGNRTWGGYMGLYLLQCLSFMPSYVFNFVMSLMFFLSLNILLDMCKRKWILLLVKARILSKKFLIFLKDIFKWSVKTLALLFLKFIKILLPHNLKERLANFQWKIQKREKIKVNISNDIEEKYRELLQQQQDKIRELEQYINSRNNSYVDEYGEVHQKPVVNTLPQHEQELPLVIRENATLNSGGALPVNRGKYKLPPLELLDPHDNTLETASREELMEQAVDLKRVLEEFKITGKVISVKAGPVITLHEFEPSAGTKSSRVIGLADDIARSLRVSSARISVIANKNALGIELPNKNRNTIFLKDLFNSDDYKKSKCALPLVLGTNISGDPVIIDLAKAPHLLIAGTTGSGKSVSVNTMILSLLYKFTPDECKFLMIDPKMLELSVYEGIPHLLSPVVVDSQKAVNALKWVVGEMEDRYKIMSSLGVRNIAGYNEKLAKAKEDGVPLVVKILVGYDEYGDPIYENKTIETKAMPYIVVVVDEMADLMITAGKDIEALIQRIAQMARAAGIHIIMATQRPSVDVITGVIKANFPSRISFLVSSKIDSKVILGDQGAEQLLGMGDMLYSPNGGKISRAHGPFVSDYEVERIVNFIKNQNFRPDYIKAMLEDSGSDDTTDDIIISANSEDDIYEQAVNIVKRDRKTSISYIQRQLRIGYNKAANLVERMEAEGILTAPNSQGKREIIE